MIKKFIRNWLDIKDYEPPKPLEDEITINELELRRLIGEAIHDLLNHESDDDYYTRWGFGKQTTNLFVKVINHAVIEPSRVEAKNYLDGIVNKEEFIDEVVARIKNKQL